MKLNYKIKRFLNKIYHKKKVTEQNINNIQNLQIVENEYDNEEEKKRKKSEIIKVSDELRKFLNSNLLYSPVLSREIRKYDIQDIITLINNKNESRTNEIKISAEIVDEFISIIEKEIEEQELCKAKDKSLEVYKKEQEKFSLGELEIDISNKNFKVKEFVDKHKKISYILKLKISSIKDIDEGELEFLSSRYGIIYNYSGEEYHLDEIIKINNKLKEFIPENIKYNLENAQSILNNIFENFELYTPKAYVMKEKSVKLVNGENLNLPNFKVLENATYYSQFENIFNNQKASEKGYRKICRETLKIAGFNVIDNIESFTDTIKKYDLIISDQKYRIDVDADGIRLVC